MSIRYGTVMEKKEALQMNAIQLAYLGDCVWEMIVRYELVKKRLSVHHMHKECVKLVNARAQADIMRMLDTICSEEEREIVRRGRNSHPGHTVPHNQNPEDYALSTGFEALFGFLYLTGNDERIKQIIQIIKEVYFHG